jgi:hypothetical protein
MQGFLFKYTMIVIYSILYSIISYYLHNGQTFRLVENMALIMSLFFFHEIKMFNVLNQKSLLLIHYPVPVKMIRFINDFIGGYLIFIFGSIVLVYEGIVLHTQFGQIGKSISILLIFYIVSIYFGVPENKKKRYLIAFLYGVICLVIFSLLLKHTFLFTFILMVLFSFFTYISQYRSMEGC